MIIHNRIKCLKCGDIIESKSVHDFRWCSCKACAVDGGHYYLKRIGEPTDWEDMSECIEDPPDPPEQSEYELTAEQRRDAYDYIEDKLVEDDFFERLLEAMNKEKYKKKRDNW